VKAAIPIIVGLAVIMFTSSPKQTGFLGYYSNLRPGPKGGVKERWLKPGVDFSNYNKLMPDCGTRSIQ
jgi:hypothetical protein